MKSVATMTLNEGVQKQAKNGTAKVKPLTVVRQVNDLEDLFLNELRRIYWAEKALTQAIIKMIRNATAFELINALSEQLEVTRGQLLRLERVFSSIRGQKPMDEKCEAMESLIMEAEALMQKTTKGIVRDAAIILACQKMEHYEIATYGTLCSFAKTLGESHAEVLLQLTLNEEKYADEALTKIAEAFVNFEAASTYDC